jgi:hypothetical protein
MKKICLHNRIHKLRIIALIVTISFLFQFKTINEFPQYIHNWAQTDRYALAIGFVENGSNFFLPQTNIFNNQFPGDFDVARNTTVTSVDFPIHDYLVSLLMRLAKTTNPWCFKIYTLLYSFLGLFYLYNLSGLFTESFSKKIVIVLFALSSPIYLYYQAGFLPTIPSISNAIIGFFFYFNYLKYDLKKDFILSIVFLTIATLARLPFAIVLVAVICFNGYYMFKNKKINWFQIFPVFVAVLFIGAYYLYNIYLRANYGSLFLNHLIPATNFIEFKDCLNIAYTNWSLHYFTKIHYWYLVLLMLVVVISLMAKKSKLNTLQIKLVVLLAILFLGVVFYYILMAIQFNNHDYYFLDTFYLPVVLLFMLLITSLPVLSNLIMNKILSVCLLLVFVPIFMLSNQMQMERRQLPFEQKGITTPDNFKEASIFLDSLHIPLASKILVISPDSPNSAFVLMKRKGYVIMVTDSVKINQGLNWDFDFVVVENTKLITEVLNDYPLFINKVTKLASNNKITIYVKKQKASFINLESFLDLNLKNRYFHQLVNFDTLAPNCSNIDSLSSFCFSGKRAGFVFENTEWGFAHKIINNKNLQINHSTILVKTIFNLTTVPNECLLCVSIKNNGNDLLFLAENFGKKLKTNCWAKQEFVFLIPKLPAGNNEVTTFIWNTGKNKLFYDNFEIAVYQ